MPEIAGFCERIGHDRFALVMTRATLPSDTPCAECRPYVREEGDLLNGMSWP